MAKTFKSEMRPLAGEAWTYTDTYKRYYMPSNYLGGVGLCIEQVSSGMWVATWIRWARKYDEGNEVHELAEAFADPEDAAIRLLAIRALELPEA